MTALHSNYTEVGHITISNNYYYQPYSDEAPYFVDYADIDDENIEPEGKIFAYCNTKEEADAIAAYLIDQAEAYNNSLLKGVYTFTEWLDFVKIKVDFEKK